MRVDMNPLNLKSLSIWTDVENPILPDVSPLDTFGDLASVRIGRLIACKRRDSYGCPYSKNTSSSLGSSSNVQLEEEKEDDTDDLISIWNETVLSKSDIKASRHVEICRELRRKIEREGASYAV